MVNYKKCIYFPYKESNYCEIVLNSESSLIWVNAHCKPRCSTPGPWAKSGPWCLIIQPVALHARSGATVAASQAEAVRGPRAWSPHSGTEAVQGPNAPVPAHETWWKWHRVLRLWSWHMGLDRGCMGLLCLIPTCRTRQKWCRDLGHWSQNHRITEN